jgi:hypothetical protein
VLNSFVIVYENQGCRLTDENGGHAIAENKTFSTVLSALILLFKTYMKIKTNIYTKALALPGDSVKCALAQ